MRKTCTLLILLNCLVIQSIAQWHDWDQSHLNQITTENSNYSFDTDVVFQAPSSIKVDYQDGATITFPYRYDDADIYYGGYFNLAIYNPSASHEQDEFIVEFIDDNQVKAVAKAVTIRDGWNRLEIQQKQRYDYKRFMGFNSLSDYIPRRPDKIRIKTPAGKSGTFYIGKLFLKNNMGSPKLQFDRQSKPIPEEDLNIPELPTTISASAQADLDQVMYRIEESNGVADYLSISSIATDKWNDLVSKFEAYEITHNGEYVGGNNKMIEEGAADYKSNEVVYSGLMKDVAVYYRNVEDATQKSALLNMFNDLFDYGTFIGGMPDSWAGCDLYLTGVFLMQQQLKESGRLTDKIVNEYINRIGYQRIFLDYSIYIKNYSKKFKTSDRGEDIDFIRIVSKQFLMIALMYENTTYQYRDMKRISNYYSEYAFRQSPGISDGYKSDGVAYHHWGWIDQYGTSGTFAAAKILYQLAGGEFRVKEEGHQLIKEQLLGEDKRSLYNIIPKHLSGKGGELYSYGGNGPNSATKFAYLALAGSPDGSSDIDPEMASIFLRYTEDLFKAEGTSVTLSAFEQKTKESLVGDYQRNDMPEGHFTFGHGCMFSHRRDGWLVTMKGHSKYQYVRESSDPFITYLGYGTLHCVKGVWNRYGWPKLSTDMAKWGYDWRKYPGTTTVHFNNFSDFANKEYKRYWTSERFVGGVSQEGNGIFVMPIKGSQKNNLGSFRAKKSWFCFDDFIVCVGSGISNTISNEQTCTNLYQDAISSSTKTYFNSTSAVTGLDNTIDETLDSNKWLMDGEGMGYWVPMGSQLVVNRKEQTSRDWKNSKDATGKFATAWIKHGKAPSNATYWYIQRMATTPEKMQEFGQEMNTTSAPFELLRKDSKIHAVYANKQNTYGVAIFDSSSPINLGGVVNVSEPCVLMCKQRPDDGLLLTVSNPDVDFEFSRTESGNQDWGYSQTHTIDITIEGNWTIATPKEYASITHENGNTIIAVNVSEGASFDVELTDNSPVNTINWCETFNQADGTSSDEGRTGWNIEDKADNAIAKVTSGRLVVSGNATWCSKKVDISSADHVRFNCDLSLSNGETITNSDSLIVYYTIDNGNPIILEKLAGAFEQSEPTLCGIEGDQLQLFIQSKVVDSNVEYTIDNVDIVAMEQTLESVALNENSISLNQGKQFDLIATLTPATFANEKLTWISEDESIATVDQSGKVTAVNVGQTRITATTNFVNMSDACMVVVEPQATSVSKFVENGLEVYPNPISSSSALYNRSKLDVQKVEIATLNGRIIFAKEVSRSRNSEIALDINENKFQVGIYILKVHTANKGVLTFKLIKR